MNVIIVLILVGLVYIFTGMVIAAHTASRPHADEYEIAFKGYLWPLIPVVYGFMWFYKYLIRFFKSRRLPVVKVVDRG